MVLIAEAAAGPTARDLTAAEALALDLTAAEALALADAHVLAAAAAPGLAAAAAANILVVKRLQVQLALMPVQLQLMPMGVFAAPMAFVCHMLFHSYFQFVAHAQSCRHYAFAYPNEYAKALVHRSRGHRYLPIRHCAEAQELGDRVSPLLLHP